MSYEESAGAAGSPFNGMLDRRNLFLTPHHREILATLRYGIEARKGFILFVGDAGTGKSTLLQRLAHELDPSVTFVVIPDAHESVIEVIRSLLRGLGMEPASASETELIHQCRTVLRAQAAAGRNVGIAFDNAHHMSDEAIEQVRQNFIGTGPESAFKQFAQVVMVGRPELMERLLRPPLRQGAVPLALECTISALTGKEVGEYIEHRLRAADLPVDLFAGAAVQSIAHYSGGKFRLINALCDRAFLTADPRSRKQIGAALFDNAAKDLDLWQPKWVRKDEPEINRVMQQRRDDVFRFQVADEDMTETVGQTFHHLSGGKNRQRSFLTRSPAGRTASALLVTAVLTVPGVWLSGDLLQNSLSGWNVLLGDLTGAADRYSRAQTETAPVSERRASNLTDAMEPPTAVENPPPIIEQQTDAMPPADRDEKVAVQPPPTAAESSVSDQPKRPRRVIARANPDTSAFPNESRNDPAWQISKAIENRAITGVRVTVRDDIAYLDGRVATDRQRRAAELAARETGDVRGIRNRITIE
ncbi:MAG TPA: AAA family ATPase [Candidatus Limnocylindria bacterium]|nr:AAA family ATPase [Candidatus Limnocylindria bacterium]